MRAAVIGCGVQGRLHVAALARLEGVSVRAVCDSDPTTLGRVRQDFEIPHAYRDFEDLLEGEALDLVCICTMPNTHRTIALHAFAAGVDVLCEKPFALNFAEAEEMVAAASAARRVLTVGFNMRFMRAAQHASEVIGRGDIGKPVYARASLRCGVPNWGSHLVKAIAGGGILAGSGVHMIDLVRWLTGQPKPKSVAAFACSRFPRVEIPGKERIATISTWDGENLIDGYVRFEEGLHMSMRADARLNRSDVRYWFEIRGEDGRIEFNPLDEGGGQDPAAVEEVLRLSVEREIEDLVEALRDGRAPSATAAEALVVQAVVDGLYESAATRRELQILVQG